MRRRSSPHGELAMLNLIFEPHVLKERTQTMAHPTRQATARRQGQTRLLALGLALGATVTAAQAQPNPGPRGAPAGFGTPAAGTPVPPSVPVAPPDYRNLTP